MSVPLGPRLFDRLFKNNMGDLNDNDDRVGPIILLLQCYKSVPINLCTKRTTYQIVVSYDVRRMNLTEGTVSTNRLETSEPSCN